MNSDHILRKRPENCVYKLYLLFICQKADKICSFVMCTKTALSGIKDILNILDKSDLDGLITTVTQGFLKTKEHSKEEAIEVILKYSPDVFSILKRRAVTRDVLFTYLHNNNITIQLPTTKDQLIINICKLWDLPENTESNNKSIIEKTDDSIKHATITNNIESMAQKFSEWFYGIMNTNEIIDSAHFFPDAYLKLNLISPSTQISDEMETPGPIVDLLFKTKTEHNLFFNPNLNSEGVQGRLDPHGLVMILACGTLHSNNSCVGVFEQVFSLARDPFCQNNWKIKNTELNLRSKSEITETPCLANNELTARYLSLPER